MSTKDEGFDENQLKQFFLDAINKERLVDTDTFEDLISPLREAFKNGRDNDVNIFQVMKMIQKSGIPMPMDDLLIDLLPFLYGKGGNRLVTAASDRIFYLLYADPDPKLRESIIDELTKWHDNPEASQGFMEYLDTLKAK